MEQIPKEIQDKIIAEAKNRYIVDETHTSLGMEIQYNKRQGFNNGAIFGYRLASPCALCEGKDAEIYAIREGAEQWEPEYKMSRQLLQDLLTLKTIKDTEGKTEYYEKHQPLIWQAVKDFLSKYQHL